MSAREPHALLHKARQLRAELRCQRLVIAFQIGIESDDDAIIRKHQHRVVHTAAFNVSNGDILPFFSAPMTQAHTHTLTHTRTAARTMNSLLSVVLQVEIEMDGGALANELVEVALARPHVGVSRPELLVARHHELARCTNTPCISRMSDKIFRRNPKKSEF